MTMSDLLIDSQIGKLTFLYQEYESEHKRLLSIGNAHSRSDLVRMGREYGRAAKKLLEAGKILGYDLTTFTLITRDGRRVTYAGAKSPPYKDI